MSVSRIEIGSVIVAAIAVVVSIAIAVQQSAQTRKALFESRVQSRISSCVSLAALYDSQSWAYDPIPTEKYGKYGLPPDTAFDPQGPNQLLAEYSGKASAVGRALQLCLVGQEDLATCIAGKVDADDKHKVDDSSPRDGVLDNVIC